MADGMVMAAEIISPRPASAPWPASSVPLLSTAVDLLLTLEDDLVADLVEHLALAIIARDEALDAKSALLSGALAMTHTQHVEIVRLEKRLANLLDQQRQARTAAA